MTAENSQANSAAVTLHPHSSGKFLILVNWLQNSGTLNLLTESWLGYWEKLQAAPVPDGLIMSCYMFKEIIAVQHIECLFYITYN